MNVRRLILPTVIACLLMSSNIRLLAEDELVPEDLAAGKSATASGTQDDHRPDNALDGDAQTRWCATNADVGYWWQVDLGEAQQVVGGRIDWEHDGKRYRYKVEASADGKTWRMLSDQTKSESREQSQLLRFDADDVRYVRITSTQLDNGSWMSFWEVEIHGPNFVKRPKPSPLASLQASTLRDVKVPEGFTATLFAGPPTVSYPTCIACAPTGEVFVGVDENGSLGKDKTRRQQVLRCIDADGDGTAEKLNVFADDVGSVRGMFYHDGSLWVLHPPLLRVFHDDDRDGVADRNETLVEGLGTPALAQRGADHCTNGFGVGIDGWIYIAVGDFGFTEAQAKDSSTAKLYGGGIARVRMDGSELEVYARNTRNIYDVAVSPEMNLFTRDNTNDGGGWDVRLSHIIQTGDYGYPRLYKNFPEDMIHPLADYGGGSPTGSLYIDEPTLPGDYARSLYTCDWGRNIVYRHPLQPKGASFEAQQEEFVKLSRPTDMDIDGQGNIYIASWKNGQFAYKGDNVGYVVRVQASREGTSPAEFPDLPKATTERLLRYHTSDSHTLRLHAQLEVLRRGDKDGVADRLAKLVGGDASLPSRIAALYTYTQLLGNKSHASLVRWTADDELREHALRALVDRRSQASDVLTEPFIAALASGNPRDRLAAAVGLGRLERDETAAALTKLTVDEDPLVAHAAVNALVAIGDAKACLTVVDSGDAAAVGTLKALRQMHTDEVVDGLLARLPRAASPQLRTIILNALCRLAYREGEWNSSWWGTRPDSRGPYFKPTAWEQTDRIVARLKEIAATADETTLAHLRVELDRNRIETKDWKFASGATLGLSDLLRKSEFGDDDVKRLVAAAESAEHSPRIRARALSALQHGSPEAAVDVAIALGKEEGAPAELIAARQRYIFDPLHASEIPFFVKMTQSEDPTRKSMALAVLLAMADNPLLDEEAKVKAAHVIDSAWTSDKMIASMLRAVSETGTRKYAGQVRDAQKHDDKQIQSAANAAAQALGLDNADLVRIDKLPYENAAADALKAQGDVATGARLFIRQRCFACHTTSPDEQPIGPYLGGIAKRYKPDELVESILRPSAKLAQGFATELFITVEGKLITGFVVGEGADEIEIRDAQGRTTILAKDDIDERIEQKTSIMPDGLAADLTPQELASLVAYLTSLQE